MSSEFENCFVTILDKHAPPLRQHKRRNTYAPYIDHELRHKMFLRKFYKKQLNKKKPDTWKQFQQLRNKINIERQKKKTEFFTRKLNEHKGYLRSTWKVLKWHLVANRRQQTLANANALNSHFCTTAKRV